MIKIKQLHPDAIVPTKGTKQSACWDLYALEDTSFLPNEIRLVNTGWAMEPPYGFRINVYVRSSTPYKRNFILANSVGIIDSDYRGELLIQLLNIGENTNLIKKGDKIAQIELVPDSAALSVNQIEVVEELSNTKRGCGGFGSTGN